MSQVDFYVLHTQGAENKERFVCRLVDTIWRQYRYSIYLYTSSPSQATMLDQLLWTAKQDSFLPHDIYPAVADTAAEILISYPDNCPPKTMEVLINLTESVPPFHQQFSRIAEIVDNTDSERMMGRTRYRFYKELAYELKSHDINT